MGITQEALVFETEDARMSALKNLPETPENMGKLDDIMKAPIKAKETVAPTPTPATPSPTPAPVAPPVAPKPGISLKDGDIEISYPNEDEFRKGMLEKEKLIRRQTEFIKKNLSNTATPDANLVNELAQLKAQIATLTATKPTPTPAVDPKATVQEKIDASQSRLADIRKMQDELDKAEDQFDPEVVKKQRQCSRAITDEMALIHGLLAQRATEDGETRKIATSTRDEITGLRQHDEQTRQAERNKQALQEELKGIDTFCSNASYPEFKMSKPAAEVENDYLSWGADVGSIYYGAPIDPRTQDGFNKMKYALGMLQKQAPALLESCKLAGVSTEPTGDIAKYLEVCELLDWRDGLRINPATGQKEQITRYHAASRKEIPDTYPSVEAAYEHRKVIDGVYKKKVEDAYKNGGTDALKATAKRDGGAVELDNASGVSSVDAGLKMTKEQAYEFIKNFDERTQDQALLKQFDEAQQVMRS